MFRHRKNLVFIFIFPKRDFVLGGSYSCCSMSGTGKCGGKLNIQDLAEYHLTLVFFFFTSQAFLFSYVFLFLNFESQTFWIFQAFKTVCVCVCIPHFLVYWFLIMLTLGDFPNLWFPCFFLHVFKLAKKDGGRAFKIKEEVLPNKPQLTGAMSNVGNNAIGHRLI